MNTIQAKFPFRALNAVSLNGTVMEFKCEMGHTFKEDMQYPRGKRHPARFGQPTINKLFSYWSNGNLKGICPKCEKTK